MSDAPEDKPEKVKKPKRPQQVYTLLVEVGRHRDDGLPEGSTGAALMCYASGVDEAEAVRETVAILKQADLAPLDVTGYGTLDERLEMGHDISEEERELMARALEENSVIVAQMTPFFEDQKAAAEDAPEPDAKPEAKTGAGPKADPRPRSGAKPKKGGKHG